MRFYVGFDLKKFKKYYKTLDDLHEYFKTLGLADTRLGELGVQEEYWITKDPSHLIVWKKNDDSIGHAIWHETSTDEHKNGDPRDEEDRAILRRLLRGRKDNIVELHEIWLKKRHRKKGYGKKFFDFFEKFIKDRGFDSIVYYTDNPTAIAICKIGYGKKFFDFFEKFIKDRGFDSIVYYTDNPTAIAIC
ncbi:MAG: GNAT family N-acetyltransferase [Candidatus Methanofastidiosia archaeon]|jgi:GNAT superfamily N-acetyltransferase